MIEGMELTLLSLSEKDWNNYGKFWDDSLFNDRKYGNKMAISDLAILLGGFCNDLITVPDDSSLRGRTGEYHIVDILTEYEQEDEEEYVDEDEYGFNEFNYEYGYDGGESSTISNYEYDDYRDDNHEDDGWHITLDEIEYYMSKQSMKKNDAIKNENPPKYHEEYDVLVFGTDGLCYEVEETDKEDDFIVPDYCCIRPVLDLSALSSSDYLKICKNSFDGYNGVKLIEFGEYPQYAADSSTIEILNDKYDDDELKTTGRTFTFVKREEYGDGSFDYVIDEVEEYEYNGKKYILFEDVFIYGCKLSNGAITSDSIWDTVWLEVSPVQWLIDDKNKRLISKIGLYAGIEDKKDSFSPPYKNNNEKKFLDEYMIKDLFQSTSLLREVDTVEDENEHSNENKTTEKKKELEELKNALLQQTVDNSSLTNSEKGRTK